MMTSAWSMRAGGASAESTATRNTSPPRAFQLKRSSKCRKVTEIVPGHDHAAGVGLADDPPNSITLVAAHGWAQLPDQLAEYDLQSVTFGDLPSCFIDGRRPGAGSATRRV